MCIHYLSKFFDMFNLNMIHFFNTCDEKIELLKKTHNLSEETPKNCNVEIKIIDEEPILTKSDIDYYNQNIEIFDLEWDIL